MPHQNHEIQRIMKECKLLRSHGCTSYIELQIYFEFMHQTILQKDNFLSCSSKQTNRQIFHKYFFKSFQQLSQLQAAKYYLHMLGVVHQYVNCNKSKIGNSSFIENHQPRSKQYEVDIIKKGFFNNTERVHYLQIDRKKSILLIKSQNNPYDLQINLENYLIRQSGANQKGKSKKEFLILKAGSESTPDQIRFAMKNVYEFPDFFAELWNFVLQVRSRNLQKIIDKLSDGGSKKGYVEIILIESQNSFPVQQSERKYLKQNEQRSVQEFEYLDTNHPVCRVSQQICSRVGAKDYDIEGHFLWGNQWQKTSKGQLKNINYDYIAVQRGAVKKVIKSFISMASGESEIPIEMYSNETNSLQLARACKYFSYFFGTRKEQCHETQAIRIDAFQKTFCSIIGFLLIRNRMQKPIQPFLGQTYQGFIDGYPINVQQIGKNQSYILLETDQIKLYGCLELKSNISGVNSIIAGSSGFLTLELIKLKKTPKIKFTIPMIQLGGLLYGERLVQIVDTSVIYEEESGTFCLLNWGKNKKAGRSYENLCDKQDFVKGQIFMLKPDKKFQIQSFIDNKQYIKDFCKEKSIEKVYGEVYGNWTTQIFFKNQGNQPKSIYNVETQKPGDLFHYIQPLPSDCRLRKDVRLLESDKITEAEKQRKKCSDTELKESTMRLIQKRA